MNEKLLSVEEVAERLGVTPDTIRHYIRTHQLTAIRIGNKYRIKESELNRFLDERSTDRDRQD